MIGIDAGTFHTVAVEMRNGALRIPKQSVPSIAVLMPNGGAIVGVKALTPEVLRSTGLKPLLLAPKLELGRNQTNHQLLQKIIRELISQALDGLGGGRGDAVLTVPPGWTFEHCEILTEALDPLGTKVRFMHEPIAMLLGAMYLAPKYKQDPRLTAKLDQAELVLICDWGAGTVDVALVHIERNGRSHEFSCLAELTEIGHGGTSIARDVVREFGNMTDEGDGAETDAYLLQAHWANPVAGRDFSRYDVLVGERRASAADEVARKVAALLGSLSAEDRSAILCVMYGGPLESADLARLFKERLEVHAGLANKQFVHIGNEFAAGLPYDVVPMRRDVLVAAGAAIFGEGGQTLPEFEYEVVLRNARGELTSSVRLAIARNLAGIQIIEPPHTGADYYVEVNQLRRTHDGDLVPTSIKAELAHYVRPNALVKYRVVSAEVGHACIEATEVPNTMGPGEFPDARSAKVFLPEKSTRFSIDL
jgi:hypothetical protein